MKRAEPYLFFNGRCDEALSFYGKVLNAKVTFLMRFSEAPPSENGMSCAQGMEDKVMHCNFTIGDSHFMASDGNGDKNQPDFSGFSLSLLAESLEEGQALANALAAEGGKVVMPFGETFWSKGFGMVLDQFGVLWMVNVDQ